MRAPLLRAALNVLLVVGAPTLITSCDDGLSPAPSGGGVKSTTIAPITFDALYVVNGESASISVINAETSAVAGTIQLSGAQYPHHVSVSPDRSLVAVAIPGFDMSGGHLGHEGHLSRPGAVVLLDAETGETRNSVRTDASNHNATFAPGTNHEVWTSQATKPGSTLVLDADTLKLEQAISVGTAPSETTFSADGRYAFVANTGSASVTVIDVPGRRVARVVTVGSGPVGAWPAPGGLAYVDNEGDHTISVLDTNRLEVVRTFDLGYVPGMVAAPSADELWITDPNRGRVEVRSPSGTVLRSAECGRGAHAVAFDPLGTRAYITLQSENMVAVMDRSTMTLVTKIRVGSLPNGIAWRSKQ